MASIKILKNKTGINILKLNYKGKKYEINLTEELGIDETLINSQLSNQPSNYSFICMLRSKAILKRDSLEKEKDCVYSNAYIRIKESNDRIPNELANHKANASLKYQIAYEKYLKAKEEAEVMIYICKAYEMRSQLLQTISSNIRKE